MNQEIEKIGMELKILTERLDYANKFSVDIPSEEQPAIPPVVVPPPSGIFRYPDLIQNMFEVAPGKWRSRDIFRSTVAALHFKLGDLDHGDGVRVSFLRQAKYPLKGNIKVFRVWLDAIPSYPNFYFGTQADGSFLFNSEKIEGAKGVVKFYTKYPSHPDDWRREVWEWRYNSGIGKADGSIKIKIGDETILDKKGWQSDNEKYPGCPNLVCIQADVSNGTLPAGSFENYDEIEITVLK